MTQLKIQFNLFYIIVLNIILGLLTFGMMPIILFLATLNYPKYIDEEGIMTRSGKRYLWSTLKGVKTTALRINGIKVTGPLELYFGSKKVLIQLGYLRNANKIMKMIQPFLQTATH